MKIYENNKNTWIFSEKTINFSVKKQRMCSFFFSEKKNRGCAEYREVLWNFMKFRKFFSALRVHWGSPRAGGKKLWKTVLQRGYPPPEFSRSCWRTKGGGFSFFSNPPPAASAVLFLNKGGGGLPKTLNFRLVVEHLGGGCCRESPGACFCKNLIQQN